jgi:AraC-like DNA-binding protein
MIPLPYLFGFAALAMAIHEWMRGDTRNSWMVSFLVALSMQEFVIGTRFGYGLIEMQRIQPFLAAVVPPLAYLSFRKPRISKSLWIHLLPIISVLLSIMFLIDALDAILAANNFFYVVLLVLIGLKGSDGLDWVPFDRLRTMRLVLWLIVILLVFSGLTDALISLDFQTSNGANTSRIVGAASAIGFPVVGGIFLFVSQWRQRAVEAEDVTLNAEDEVMFSKIETLMTQERLFIDPDINLKRIARRMIRPSRDVSRAINSQTEQNVSQYINGLRTKEACRLLRETDMPITEIVYASGYNTKSNFHREFARIMGVTPSQWRKTV